jgi:beta-galactosidase/beta-glucuronidase
MTTRKTLVVVTTTVIVAWVGPLVHGAVSPIQVPRWQPQDFAFHGDRTPEGPFQVPFSAEVTGPDGVKLTVPGFYDGDGTWKIRVSPTVEGDWTLTTRSLVTALDGRRVAFVCIANPLRTVHGGLRVDPQHPRHFVFDDGTRFFLVGYECDWLWALDTADPELKVVNRFLDKLAASGFNYVLLNAYAHDTSWRKGKTADDDYGPPPRYAWEGSNDQPDYSRLNLAYWQHYDRIIDALYRRGMIAHIMIKVYNKMVHWPAKGSPEDDLFFRWLIARYSAYPNVHWDFSKESNNEKDLDYKLGRIRFLRDNDPYRRPITTHTDTQTFNAGSYNGVLDYRSDQTHAKWHATLLDHQKQHPWPVLNVEFGYEHGPQGPKDMTYRVAQAPEEVCRRAWEVYLAGGYGAYYYTYTAWDVIRPDDTPPGYAYFKHLRDFFDATEFWTLAPSEELVDGGYCLARPGKEYVVFQSKAGPFTLRLEGLPGPAKATWFHPFTGQYQDGGSANNGSVRWTPPQTWGDAPAVLHVVAGSGSSSPDALVRSILATGWKIKGIAPQASLTAKDLSGIQRAGEAEGWLAAPSMPAMVHDILLQHGKIEVPWLPGRAEKCRWVAERDWVYATTFPCDYPQRKSRLLFRGLDTIVDVYLNGRRLGSHCNMFTPLIVDVSGHLQAQNTLVLHFHTVFDTSSGKPRRVTTVPGDPSRRVRRPGQNYGNYLGPSPLFSRVGVYDAVVLEVTDGTVLSEVVADASLNETLTEGTVTVDVAGTTDQPSVDMRWQVTGPDGRVVGESSGHVFARDGALRSQALLKVDHPRLWWPRGYGDQPLYQVQVLLLVNGRPHETQTRTLGFRRITMPQQLHFVVNGVPVRLWGADWVTPHWQTAVWDPPRVEKLFALAQNANFNAFRVWAETESPRDDFYELADARGFLLWQDFTFLPLAPEEASRAICREEATQFVKRLKHHPSIVVWNACNEAALWSHEDYNADYKDRGPWPGLAAAEEVGAICRQLDPSRYYQPSSPYYGMNPNDPREGNTHGYTNLWFVPGYDYLNFASEDTRIAAPPLRSLQRFMAPEDLWPAGYSTLAVPGNRYPYPKQWLRYTTGESWKKTGPVEQFYDATDAASLVYRLGMAEALYYQDVVERQRRGRAATDASDKRRCGGYLAWKFNDSWPQIYSGKVDYFLEPYHAYYALRRAYAPVMLSFDIGTYIYLWAVNDAREPISGTVKIQLYHLEKNEFRKEILREVTLTPGQSAVVVRLDQAGIRAFRREHILFATLTDKSGRVLARANAFADIERRLTFPDAKLDVGVKNGDLVITTDKFACCVTLEGDASGDPFGWFFEDNYFDLLPGETKVVRILGGHSAGRVTARPWYSLHQTTVEWQANR